MMESRSSYEELPVRSSSPEYDKPDDVLTPRHEPQLSLLALNKETPAIGICAVLRKLLIGQCYGQLSSCAAGKSRTVWEGSVLSMLRTQGRTTVHPHLTNLACSAFVSGNSSPWVLSLLQS